MADAGHLDIQFSKRFSRNFTSNVVYFVLNILVGLALTPFFLNTLGQAAYGLIPLATSVTGYVMFIIGALNGSISRYLTIDLQRADAGRANITFNTAFFGLLAIIAVLVPVAVAAAWYAPSFFNIGDETAEAVFLLCIFVFGSSFVGICGGSFTTPLFAYNRLDLINYVRAGTYAVQVALILLFFTIFGPSLPLVGLSYFIASCVSLMQARYYSGRVCPGLKVNIRQFSIRRLKEICSLSFWNLIGSLGWLLNTSVSLMVVNKFFGEIAGTNFSLALIWANLLMSVSGLVTSTFTPMIYSYYSNNDVEGLVGFGKTATRLVGIGMALPGGLVCIFAPWLFTVWVGPEYAVLTPLVWILVVPLLFRFQSSCTSSIPGAFLRASVPALCVLATGVLSLCLTLYLPFVGGLEIYGVALANTVSSLVLVGVFDPVYAAHVVKKPLLTFVKPRVAGVACLFVFLLCGLVFVQYVSIDPLWMLFFYGGVIVVVYAVLVLTFLVTKEEKKWIRSCLPEEIKEYIPKWFL
jgi:membrane protein EpsK